MSAYVDTSAFFAILDADDANHAEARAEWSLLLEGHESFHTTNYVLVETSALIQNRIGMDGLRAFTSDVLPVLAVHWVTEGMHRSALHALLVSSRRDLSLVDCVSFEAMRRLGIEKAFCFDHHFAQQGFQVLPGLA